METKNNTNANKSRKAIRIVISILVAIALWVYVDRGLSVEVTMKVKNVPVEFSGEDTTLADKNLIHIKCLLLTKAARPFFLQQTA